MYVVVAQPATDLRSYNSTTWRPPKFAPRCLDDDVLGNLAARLGKQPRWSGFCHQSLGVIENRTSHWIAKVGA